MAMKILLSMLIFWVPSTLVLGAGNDNRIEADGVWHDYTAEIVPAYPQRGQPFFLELRTFRFDLTVLQGVSAEPRTEAAVRKALEKMYGDWGV